MDDERIKQLRAQKWATEADWADVLDEVERLRSLGIKWTTDFKAATMVLAAAVDKAEAERDHHRETLRLLFDGLGSETNNILREREPWLWRRDDE